MNRLLVLTPCGEKTRRRLEELAAGRLRVEFLPEDCGAQTLRSRLADTEVVIGEPDAAVLFDAPVLRWVQMTWAGADRYTAAGGFPSQVTLTNMSGAYGVTIAEHAMAMLLALCRRLPAYLRQQAQGGWSDCGSEKTLEGATALILGVGDIGTQIARRCRAFGMKTVGVCTSVRKLPDCFDRAATLADAEVLLPEADAVLCALPDTAQTRGFLNRSRLERMKPDAVLVNVGRGSLIDCDALAQILASGHLWGAGLDVTQPEPLPPEHGLRRLDNVILTPHVAGVGFGHLEQTEEKIWALCLENLRRYLAGLPLDNVVDLAAGYRIRPKDAEDAPFFPGF